MPLLTRRQFTKIAAIAPFTLGTMIHRARADFGRLGGGKHELTILYTNDFHSAFEPIPAYWLPGSPRLGGAAHLAAMVERERAAAGTCFLLDSGDMFTGTVSNLTHGEALMEMMSLMRYDALGAGNHEFDYGWQVFDRAVQRVPFPVLCCNVRYKGHRHSLHAALRDPRAQRRPGGRHRCHGHQRRPLHHHAVQGRRTGIHRSRHGNPRLRRGTAPHRRCAHRARPPGAARGDADRRGE